MRDKPKVYKANGEWHVSVPSFGFASPRQATPRTFPSHKAAIGWLQSIGSLGTAGPVVERAASNGQDDYAYSRTANNRPVIVR